MAPWYSQGVRQELWSLLHASRANSSDEWAGVVFKAGRWTIDSLRNAEFCVSARTAEALSDQAKRGSPGCTRSAAVTSSWPHLTARLHAQTRVVCPQLCPSGWGFGWRTYLAVATLCIPVIVQPLVEQACKIVAIELTPLALQGFVGVCIATRMHSPPSLRFLRSDGDASREASEVRW